MKETNEHKIKELQDTEYKNLYSVSDIRSMRIAEESRLPGKNRVEEIKEYARRSGVKRIISCNPAGQADFLAQNNTDLNISFGLCIGHDIVLNQKSKAPITTLIVKDRKYKHNPFEAFKET